MALVAGSTGGGVLLGVTVTAAWYLLAPFSSARSGVVLGVVTLSAIAVGWPGLRRWLPERACQVASSQLLRFSRERAAIHWGVTLGVGVSTFVVTPAFYALVAVALAQERALMAGLLCTVYGAVRGATIACFALTEARREAKADEGVCRRMGTIEHALRAPLMVAIVVATTVAIA